MFEGVGGGVELGRGSVGEGQGLKSLKGSRVRRDARVGRGGRDRWAWPDFGHESRAGVWYTCVAGQ